MMEYMKLPDTKRSGKNMREQSRSRLSEKQSVKRKKKGTGGNISKKEIVNGSETEYA